MQTYSHLILTGALNGRFAQHLRAKEKLPPLRSKALLLGSILPDLPLITISIITIGYDILAGNFANGALRQMPLLAIRLLSNFLMFGFTKIRG